MAIALNENSLWRAVFPDAEGGKIDERTVRDGVHCDLLSRRVRRCARAISVRTHRILSQILGGKVRLAVDRDGMMLDIRALGARALCDVVLLFGVRLRV